MILPSSNQNILLASNCIKQGGVVAFPTETVYGLGANALNAEAVQAIFQLKGRPQDNPLIVHLSCAEQAEQVAFVQSEVAKKLLNAMPLPMSVVLKKRSVVPSIVSAGLDTVAVRVPTNAIARRLIEYAGVPISAPSANKSGRPSPTCASHVEEDFSQIMVLDGGKCEVGLESTVVDASGTDLVILRTGAVSCQDIFNITGVMPSMYSGGSSVPPSPGMKYKHYSPSCDVVFAEWGQGIEERVCAEIVALQATNAKIAVLSLGRNYAKYGVHSVVFANANMYASGLFACFRQLEKEYNVIIAEGLEGSGIGTAINNRLKKASERLI